MLKKVIQILICIFVLCLYYDAIVIWLNQIDLKEENQLLIVKHELEETIQQVENTTPYETYDFPIWPIALAFSCAFCSVACHFILPHNSLSLKRGAKKDNAHHTLTKFNKTKRNHKKEKDEFSYYEEINNKDGLDIRLENDNRTKDNLGLITNPDLSPENKGGEEKSISNVHMPKLFNDDMFSHQSSLNVIENVNHSPSVTSLEHIEWGISKSLYTLLENKSISKMGLPASPRKFNGEENSGRKHYQILGVNNAVFEENASQKSEDSLDSLSAMKQDQLVGLFSVLNNNVAKAPQSATSEKSINVQLLTYNDNDILKNIERRLEKIEFGLRKSEERTKDWGKRINVAETELVDLHEQMYTIFSKFEEEKKTNYIIVSKVSKDKILPKDNDMSDRNLVEESDEFDQVDEKGENDNNISKKKIVEDMASAPNPEAPLTVKDSSEEESEDEQSANDNKSDEEDNQKSVEESNEVILTELKQRSIALEALLECKSRSRICSSIPKKKIPQLNVPPHVLPPYKRSSFAGTDSKAELRKRKINMRMINSGNEFFWRARV